MERGRRVCGARCLWSERGVRSGQGRWGRAHDATGRQLRYQRRQRGAGFCFMGEVDIETGGMASQKAAQRQRERQHLNRGKWSPRAGR